MSDRSDKDLSRHIRAVFDAYDEPYDPASWRQLQRRRRGKAAAVYVKWAGAAASVAVLLAAGVSLWNNSFSPEAPRQALEIQQAEKPAGKTVEKLPPAGNEASRRLSQADAPSGSAQQQVAAAVPAPGTPVPGRTQPQTGNDFAAAVDQTAANEEAARTGNAIADAETAPAANASAGVAPAEEAGRAAGNLPAGNIASSGAAPFHQAEDPVSAGNDPAAGNYPAYKEKEAEKTAGGRFSVGFVTTSLMNYASGNTGTQVHFGAGITSGWKLSERLSLHSGVILAENSLSLNNSNSSVQASAYAAPASNDALSAVGKNSIVQHVSPQSMDVNLLVMDLPLNLTYRLDVGKTGLLLTGGLSSFAYLDQEYSYHNTMQLYTNATVDAPKPVVRNEKAFSHFDLARQLNLAIGTEVSLGKGSVLIVEPYVKYPLGELTSEHIKFGSAGMNLRLSFQTGN